jgi:hypothetical protein
MSGAIAAVGSSLEGFYFDPKAGRPDRLRKTLRLVAEEIQRMLAWVMLGRGRSAYRCLFVTLTYRANTKGDPRDVSACLNRVRDWLARQGLPMYPYLWVAELQKRGALHYHAMVWLPRRLHLPKLDRCGWWKHGMTKVETARNPVGYLVKYASKFRAEDIARFRKGTRLYGYGGLVPEIKLAVRRARWPRWAREAREAQETAFFVQEREAEEMAQEREEAVLLHWMWPDDHPAPESVDEAVEWEAYVDRELEEREQDNRARALLRRGAALFARCSGGFVDRVSGEFFATPWAAEFVRGVLRVWPKEAV